MKYFAGLFAILGLAFHIRVYKVFSEPVTVEVIRNGEEQFSAAVRLILVLALPWIPLLFYSACLAFSFLTFRNRLTVAVGLAVLAISIPYFVTLFQISDSSRILCLFAGGGAVFNHMTVGPTKQANTLLDGSNV